MNSVEQRELVIDNIFNALNGITYLPYKTTYYGYPHVDSTDKVKISNMNDIEYDSYIFNHTLKYDGAFSGIIETTALTKTQSSYNDTRSLKKWKRNVEFRVDKINGEIQANIKQQTEISEKIAEQKITVDEMTAKMSEVNSNIDKMDNNLTELNEKTASTELRVNEFEIKFEDKTTTIDEELQKNTQSINDMSYKFNTDDLIIAKESDPVNARINNTGMKVYSYNELKAIFNHNGSGIQKLIVVGSAQLGNLQIVKGTDKNGQACTDFHHLVSNIQELTDLEVE